MTYNIIIVCTKWIIEELPLLKMNYEISEETDGANITEFLYEISEKNMIVKKI